MLKCDVHREKPLVPGGIQIKLLFKDTRHIIV